MYQVRSATVELVDVNESRRPLLDDPQALPLLCCNQAVNVRPLALNVGTIFVSKELHRLGGQ